MLLKVSYAKHFLSLPLNVKLFRRGVKSAQWIFAGNRLVDFENTVDHG